MEGSTHPLVILPRFSGWARGLTGKVLIRATYLMRTSFRAGDVRNFAEREKWNSSPAAVMLTIPTGTGVHGRKSIGRRIRKSWSHPLASFSGRQCSVPEIQRPRLIAA